MLLLYRPTKEPEDREDRIPSLSSLSLTCPTHPLPVQQQVDFEDHAVVDRDLLISVEDLEDPAEDGALVDPRRAEAALL